MEKDIEVLEEFLEIDRRLRQNKVESDYDEFCERRCVAIENLIKGYRELEKSKITYERARDLQEENKRIVDNNYISKSKIKEKIEELKADIEQKGDYIVFGNTAQIEVLQELMEDK